MEITKIAIYQREGSYRLLNEAEGKGYLREVYVLLDEELYFLNFYTIERLIQDFELEVAEQGYFSNDPNTVLVPTISIDVICENISHLYKEGYFENLKLLDTRVIELKKLVRIDQFHSELPSSPENPE